MRTLLAKFGLKADQVASLVARLSPGERTRAAMALLQARGVNLLVLDEPTNHLDLPAIEQLEQALESFAGTLLLVTHDRRLLDTCGSTSAGTWSGDRSGLADLRLASANAASGRAGLGSARDLAGWAASAAALEVDVLAVQEVDHLLGRSGRVDQTAVIAAVCAGGGPAWSARFAAAVHGTPGRADTMRPAPATLPDEPSYGIALLTRTTAGPGTSWDGPLTPALSRAGRSSGSLLAANWSWNGQALPPPIW